MKDQEEENLDEEIESPIKLGDLEIKPLEVKIIKEPEKPEEADEDSHYHEGLEVTKEEIEEFEKDGT